MVQRMTPLELLILFWEDYYHKNPIDAKRTESGEVFFETGDSLIDKWEREIAMGLEPDLLEGMPPEEREREAAALERLLARQGKIEQAEASIGEGFEDDYTEMLAAGMPPILGSAVPRKTFEEG